MNCHDTRELLSSLVDGALTPDEQRRVEAHLAECADCRKEHERFSATITLLRQMERPRAPVGFVDRVLAAAQPAPWHRRLLGRLFLPLSVKLPAEAAALLLVGGLAVFVFQRTPELQQAARHETFRQAAREHAPSGSLSPSPSAVTAPPPPAAPPAVTAPPPPAAPSAVTAPPTPPAPSREMLSRSRDEGAFRAELQAKPKTSAEREQSAVRKQSAAQEQTNVVSSERDSDRAAKVAPASPAPPSPAPPSPTTPLTDELKKEKAPAQEPATLGRASEPAPQPRPAPAEDRRADSAREKTMQSPAAVAPPSSRSGMRVLPSADVTGRLAVKDLETAQRALTDLLARSGGVVISRREDAGTILVDVAVPKTAYADFNAGLTRIGAWQSEGEPSESATSVRVTLRLVP